MINANRQEISGFEMDVGDQTFGLDSQLVTRIEVQESLEQLSMCTATISAEEPQENDEPAFEIGQAIRIGLGFGDDIRDVFEGDVVSLEPQFPEAGPVVLELRGYDRMHRLRTGRKTRFFENALDSDAVAEIAQEAGLEADIEPTKPERAYIAQRNVTDMEFVTMLARRNHYRAEVRGDTLIFRKPDQGSSASLSLAWGESLRSCDMRLNGLQQVGEVVVRGWDAKNKRAIIGHASSGDIAPTGGSDFGMGQTEKQLGKRTETLVDVQVDSQAEADAIARAVLERRARGFAVGSAVSHGHADLRPGVSVSLEGINRFSGLYFVTATHHILTRDGGFVTRFEFEGSATGGQS